MWRALEKVKKPFVVSMGNVAASGGYYISMGADEIYAEPGTITGSIGVVSGKFALEGLYNKIGITTEVLSRGKNSGFWSTTTPMTDSERKAMQVLMEDIYGQFTSKAAKGRKMKLDKLKSLAGGRIYTGEVAVKNGLVDKLGTLDDAVKRAQQLAGLDADAKVERVLLPKPPSPFEALFGDINISLQNQSKMSMVKQLEEVSPRNCRTTQVGFVDEQNDERATTVVDAVPVEHQIAIRFQKEHSQKAPVATRCRCFFIAIRYSESVVR